MSCNGRHHQPNCTCSFRGGRRIRSSAGGWRGWSSASIRGYKKGPWSKCPVCRDGVYFIPGPHGGGTFFDCLGPPWTLHPCTDTRRKYSPFGRSGKPKLRLVKTKLQEQGFLPTIVRRVEPLYNGAILHAVVWNTPTVLHLGTTEPLSLDVTRPVYVLLNGSGWGVLNYFPVDSFEAVNIPVREDTSGPLDLLMDPVPKAADKAP